MPQPELSGQETIEMVLPSSRLKAGMTIQQIVELDDRNGSKTNIATPYKNLSYSAPPVP